MKPFVLLLLLLGWANQLRGQAPKDTVTFRIVSYNVENLFDCLDDSTKQDDEFLPEAVRHWTFKRYYRKLDNLAKVIAAVGNNELPAIVGLCEVENDRVLHDLTRHSALRKAGYRYVMTESEDERGIDVALLYQRHLFKLLGYEALRVSPPGKHFRPTRDVLHVSGLLLNGDTLDLFVAHFPSRSEGTKASEPYRLAAAGRVKQAVDSICLRRLHPQVMVMGDFNDTPKDRSIRQVLNAEAPPAAAESVEPHRLYHLLADKAATRRDYGSYKYQGMWSLLDHLLVTGTLLLPAAPLSTSTAQADVFQAPFLLDDDDKQGGRQPFRTYRGMKYLGGFSDHLPVYAEFQLVY